jgi:hypothetical protein
MYSSSPNIYQFQPKEPPKDDRLSQLAKQLDIARSRIGYLTVKIDESMAIAERREEVIQSLERQLASEKRRRRY